MGASRKKSISYEGYQIDLSKGTVEGGLIWMFFYRQKRLGKSSRKRRYKNHWNSDRKSYSSIDAALKAAKAVIDEINEDAGLPDRGHKWKEAPKGYEYCRVCGVMRRTDGPQRKSCPGKAPIVLRKENHG